MPFITLPAHFDGEKICLDEPYPLRPNITLMVVVLADRKGDASASGLRLGDLPALFRTLPRLSPQESADFMTDIQSIRTEFHSEERLDPWAFL